MVRQMEKNSGGTGSCNYALFRNVYQTDQPGNCLQQFPPIIEGVCNTKPDLDINAEGYFWGQLLIKAVIERYTSWVPRI